MVLLLTNHTRNILKLIKLIIKSRKVFHLRILNKKNINIQILKKK